MPLSSTVTATSLAEAARQGAVFAYGNFITVLINFVILAWIIFLMVQGVNAYAPQARGGKAGGRPRRRPADVALLTEIRDLLAANSPTDVPSGLDQNPGPARPGFSISGMLEIG